VTWWIDRVGARAIGRIGLGDLKLLLDGYATTRKPATCNRLRAAVSSVFRYAIRENRLTRNPAAALAHRTENNQVVRWLSASEMAGSLRFLVRRTWSVSSVDAEKAGSSTAPRGGGDRWSPTATK
jgi:site-specific recombinase XerD